MVDGTTDVACGEASSSGVCVSMRLLSVPVVRTSPLYTPSPSPLPPYSSGGVINRNALNGLVRLLRAMIWSVAFTSVSRL